MVKYRYYPLKIISILGLSFLFFLVNINCYNQNLSKKNESLKSAYSQANAIKNNLFDVAPVFAHTQDLPLADITEKYMKKGDKVYIEGRLKTRNWEDDQKVKHYKTEVIVKDMIMLGGKKKEESNKEMAVEEVIVEE